MIRTITDEDLKIEITRYVVFDLDMFDSLIDQAKDKRFLLMKVLIPALRQNLCMVKLSELNELSLSELKTETKELVARGL